jgi:isoleucyl-tRNA synthetase
VIWTTTPWTIPANQAFNVHPELEYALVATPRGTLLLAVGLVDACLQRYGLRGEVIATASGAALAGIRFRHPLYARSGPVIPADYVGVDAGTGIVHAAPAYGVEDFNACMSHGFTFADILNPVQGNGVYVADLPFFGGLHIWKANPQIVAKLDEVGALFAHSQITHSYMHCWRHRSPVIYRAAPQWFVGMDRVANHPVHAGQGDGNPPNPLSGKGGDENGPPAATHEKQSTLRELALKGVDDTAFYPAWGQARLRAMIAGRPDWCISRQRNWGVPIPFFIHKASGALHPRTVELMEEVARRVEQAGIEAWFKLTAEELLGAEAADYEKISDTLDVWFDSGTTHWHVLRGSHRDAAADGEHWADMYLEGSDQHRGWFQSSLLTGCAIDGRAPYRQLLTHGFTVDEKGYKMSKSRGNGIEPQDICNKLGADMLRLWIASTDYSGEISLSEEILKRVTDSYRRIRNTLRFLLANIADYDHAQHALPVEQWLEIDRYALALTQKLQEDVSADYGRYEFHLVVQKLQQFCSEDLGGFYLDILKDRLYTAGANSAVRRSAQNALYHITHALVRLMAPILSFTGEEVWTVLTGNDQVGVFEQQWYVLPETGLDAATSNAWFDVRNVRELVNKKLEEQRAAGAIGSALQAEVEVLAGGKVYESLARRGDDLKFVFITSRVALQRREDGPLDIFVCASNHAKCERCWHYRADVGSNAQHPTLCGRCVSCVEGDDAENGKRRYA